MDNDTPSSSAAAVAMDVVDALRQSSSHAHSHSHSHSHFDDDELRRYIVASPQSQSSEHQQQQQHNQQHLTASLMGMNTSSTGSYTFGGSNHPSPAQTSSSHAPPAASAAGGGALETALAALGESGRQQLLAILQIAAAGNSAASAGPDSSLAPFAASGTSQQQPSQLSASAAFPPTLQHSINLAGQFSAQQHSQGPSPSSSNNSPSNASGGSHASQNGKDSGNNASAIPGDASMAAQIGALPNYYSNAFRQYSAHAPAVPHHHNQQLQGNTASTPNSASNSSAKPSPALSAVTSHSQQQVQPNHTYNHQQQHSATYSNTSQAQQQHQHPNSYSLPNNMNFTMPDANFFRSPGTFGGVPGTSSTAFYSENGNPEDSDVRLPLRLRLLFLSVLMTRSSQLLFTPLMSPALTASTQPGPSVGPLPESFANLSTQSQSKYPGSDHINPSQGVAPMTVFSPLTSPALRPQGHPQASLPVSAQSQIYGNNQAPSSSRSQNGNNGSSGKIRGASKNGPKTRPSPIIRPTIDTDIAKQSNNTTGGGKSLSRTSSVNSSAAASKKTSHHHHQTSSSAVPSPVSATSNFTSFPQPPYRQQSSSVPASPAFYPTNGNNSTSINTGGNTAKAFSNLNMTRLQENIAQTAVQNSPSPHQFDLSGVMPAFMNMQPAAQGNSNSVRSTQQGQQQHVASQQFANGQQAMNAPIGSLDDLMALPSPLDLNNILSMLSQNNSFTSTPDQQAANSFQGSNLGLPANALQNLPPPNGPAAFDPFLLKNYQQQQQQLPPHSMQSGSNAAQAFVAAANSQANALNASQGQKPAPLTPASFMNLPANQYSVLSGLLADHQHPSPQLNETQQGKNQKTTSTQDRKKSSKVEANKQREGENNKHIPAPIKPAYGNSTTNDQAMEPAYRYPPTSEEMQSSIALNATSPVSPEILAQNIKQVAAAAIAAKDAKSRSKAKGASRRRMTNSQQESEAQASDSKKRAKKEGSNGDALGSPEKPFSLDDGPSAATSIYGGSGPASTETSPMLAPQADSRKSSHKVAEQRRRDSLKLCFEELRFILPPINPDEDEDFNGGPGSRRPGENNVGGQRGKNYTVDPTHPNKGISKVAMLRKSNECKQRLLYILYFLS